MLTATCHCGSVKLTVRRKPRSLTDCNCSICRRYGTRWAYYKAREVQILAAPGATQEYTWGERSIAFVRCATCGGVTHWLPVVRKEDSRIGVNARNFDPAAIGTVRVRRLDGASTWKYLD